MARRLWHAVTPDPHWWTTRSGRRRSERGFELLPQCLRRLERLVRFQVALPGTVERAGNVARHRIDRFLLAAIALRRARVEHEPLARAEVAHDVVGPTSGIEDERSLNWPGAPRGGVGARQPGLRQPPRPPAVEDRDARVAEPARQPPQPHREVAAVGVVRDDLRVVVHAPSPERPHEIGALRKGMAAVAAGLPSRQVVIGVGEHGARDVPGLVGARAVPRHPSGRGARR